MRIHRILAVGALLLLAAARCGGSLPDYDYSKEPDPRKTEYIIGVSDQLQITVWGHEAVSGAVGVRPDGTVTMPLVGDLKAAGRTPTQLRNEIQQRIKSFIKDESAVVTVAVVAVNSYRFTVSGEVNSPGVFTSQQYVTIVEAVALAGGFTRFAERNKIFIVRRTTDGTSRQIPISYDAIASGQHEEMNIVLVAGDTVIVP